MAAPTCMRSLTGSFSSSSHHSPAAASAWAAAAASASARSHHLTPSINTHNTHIYTHHLQNFNSHHDRSYHHHLQPSNNNHPMGLHQAGLRSPSPMPSAGRRRSSSIRSKNPPPFIKFDPFADEPLVPAAAATSPPASAGPAAHAHSHSADAAVLSTLDAAAPTEIQRYTSPSASSRRIIASQQSPVHSAFGPVNGGNRGGAGASLRYAGPIGSQYAPVSRAASPAPQPAAPLPPPQPLRSSTPTPRASSGPSALGGPNISKLVAGIMLNRVAVGKPMRRRVSPVSHTSRQYIKSGLSSVVSCEA